jgi:hypothetical protein
MPAILPCEAKEAACVLTTTARRGLSRVSLLRRHLSEPDLFTSLSTLDNQASLESDERFLIQ